MRRSRFVWLSLVIGLVGATLACSTLTAGVGNTGATPTTVGNATTEGSGAPTALAEATEGQMVGGAFAPSEAEIVLAGPQVYLVDLDGPTVQSILSSVEGIAFFTRPSWSPDGNWIAFLGNAPTDAGTLHSSLFAIRPDGTDLRRLTNVDQPTVQSFAWAPREARLAISAAHPGEGFELFMLGLADGELTQLTDQGGEDPAWSPTGDQIAIAAFREEDYQLYLLDPDDSSRQRKITSEPGRAFEPTWSPPAAELAFASDRDGSWDNYDIYTVGADGQGRIRVTNSEWHEIQPRWSPDGSRIAFLRQRIEGRAAYDVIVINPDGSNEINLTAEALEEGQVPTESPFGWSPSGGQLAFLGFDDTLYVAQVDGSGISAYDLEAGATGHPAWRPTR